MCTAPRTRTIGAALAGCAALAALAGTTGALLADDPSSRILVAAAAAAVCAAVVDCRWVAGGLTALGAVLVAVPLLWAGATGLLAAAAVALVAVGALLGRGQRRIVTLA